MILFIGDEEGSKMERMEGRVAEDRWFKAMGRVVYSTNIYGSYAHGI
ncbi:MAG: hypothetical protein MJE68_02795 [Proteobacteria bacterium]|nr:hypothetical protein [Pseudomonadota bacterium]